MSVLDPTVQTRSEIDAAFDSFVKAARKDARLGLLFLIDPIRAFGDAGISLSSEARKKIRRTTPRGDAKTREAYDEVRRGERALPFKCVSVTTSARRVMRVGGK